MVPAGTILKIKIIYNLLTKKINFLNYFNIYHF